jgi:hypothetical protein
VREKKVEGVSKREGEREKGREGDGVRESERVEERERNEIWVFLR